MISQENIQTLQTLPIESVATALGMSVSRHRALCPFHSDTNPSLTFSVRKNRYRCYVCGASGGPIDLVMNYLHKDFLSACKWLSEEHSVILSDLSNPSNRPEASQTSQTKAFDASRYERYFDRPFLSNEARHFLFEERHLDPRVIRWCRLTSWKDKQGVPWLQIPYYDRNGKLIGVQNRNLAYGSRCSSSSKSSRSDNPSNSLNLSNPSNPSNPLNSEAAQTVQTAPRFRFPSGAKCSIYNLQILNLLRPGETLFIAEGCSDCWSLLSAGHKAIAIPSATLLTKKDKELLESLNAPPSSLSLHFAMFPDQDEPGERLFLQLREVLPNLVRHQLPAGCKDFSELYLKTLNS